MEIFISIAIHTWCIRILEATQDLCDIQIVQTTIFSDLLII